jgi:hypothetical protein
MRMNEKEKKYGELWLNNHPNAKPLRYEILPTGCYKVIGRSVDSLGRCRLYVNGERKLAHRAIWEHYNGKIPEGLIICHCCDFSGCVNIEHMELGTHKDNVRDREERGRHRVQKVEYVEPDMRFTINKKAINGGYLDIKINRKTGCWNVVNRVPNADGYYKVGNNGKSIQAHIFMYQRFKKDIPDGHVVRHKCNNPACVAPHHLTTGTHGDNARDKIEAGRQPRGETHANAKLSELQALFIRAISPLIRTKQNLVADLTQPEVASWLEVDKTLINHVLTGKRWRYLPDFEKIREIARELYGNKNNEHNGTA